MARTRVIGEKDLDKLSSKILSAVARKCCTLTIIFIYHKENDGITIVQ